MKKNNFAISFEKDFLNELVADESSCVKLQEHNHHLALHPFHLNNVNDSVMDILNRSIAKYDKTLGGILLGYQNIKLLTSVGMVSNDSCFIHVDIAASFFLFKPEVGKILPGSVNKKSKDHVGCLVHKVFNVSLPKPEKNDDWMGSKVELGQDILFRITFLNLEARLPYIRAEFVAILSEHDSGISTSEENLDKGPKRIVFDSNSEQEETEVAEKKYKKKKKKKQDEPEQEEQQLESSINEFDDHISFRKEKRKSKRESYSEPHVEIGSKKKSKHTEICESAEQISHMSGSVVECDYQVAECGGDSMEKYDGQSSLKKKRKHKHNRSHEEEYVESEVTLKKSKHKHISSLDITGMQVVDEKYSECGFKNTQLDQSQDSSLTFNESNISEFQTSHSKKKKKRKHYLSEEEYLHLEDACRETKLERKPSDTFGTVQTTQESKSSSGNDKYQVIVETDLSHEQENSTKKKKFKHKQNDSTETHVEAPQKTKRFIANFDELDIATKNVPCKEERSPKIMKPKQKHNDSIEFTKPKAETTTESQNNAENYDDWSEVKKQLSFGGETSPKRKKSEHKHHNSTEIGEAALKSVTSKKKSKKSKRLKPEDSLRLLEDSILEKTLLSFSEIKTNKKSGKLKKEDKNKADISLSELNIASLFDEAGNTSKVESSKLVDIKPTTFRKRYNSQSRSKSKKDQIEELLADKVTELTTKHRRSTSSDDFVMPVKKKRKLRS